MPSQGPSPGTTAVGNDTSVIPNTQSWANPTNALLSDDAYAVTTAQGDHSAGCLVTAFGFAVPTDATVSGVAVTVEGKAAVASAQQLWEVYLKKAAGSATAVKTLQVSSTSDASHAFGSSSDLWGTTITPAEINAAGWGVGVKALNNDGATNVAFSLDQVLVTVTYSGTSGSMLLTGVG